MGEVLYKVLWVEDNNTIIDGFQLVADDYDIELDVANNWEKAEEKLKVNFNEYTAIILDADCKVKETDSVTSNFFLGHASTRLSRICGEKHKFIPWYVLSAGTMDMFDTVLALINTDERKEFEDDWGQMRYLKHGEDKDGIRYVDKLFANIKRVAENTSINTVLFRHSDVFKYVGQNKVIGYTKARAYLLKMLSALYYPEENLNYEYEGNPLRKIVEYLFRSANKYGLLPNDCFDSNGHIVLLDSSRFMGGLTTKAYDGKTHKYNIRWGEAGEGKDGAGGDSIFTNEIAMFVKNILNFSSSDSHTEEDEPYTIDETKKEIFFGYVMQLCHVIKWYGEYVKQNPNVEANKSKFRILGLDSTAPKAAAPKKECPTKESIVGMEARISRNNKGHLVCGDFCLVNSEYSSKFGCKVVIKAVTENPGSNAKYHPFIATEIEIIE